MDVLFEGKLPLFLPPFLGKPVCWGDLPPPEAEDALHDLRLWSFATGGLGAGEPLPRVVSSKEISEDSFPDG